MPYIAATLHTLGFRLAQAVEARIGDRERGSYTTEQVAITVGVVGVALGAVVVIGRYVTTKLGLLK